MRFLGGAAVCFVLAGCVGGSGSGAVVEKSPDGKVLIETQIGPDGAKVIEFTFGSGASGSLPAGMLPPEAAAGAFITKYKCGLRIGAVVYATASKGKWDFLKSIGVDHVMDSRSQEFAEEVKRRTDGHGVDVVLNSLAGDFIPSSLSTVRKGGSFVEIGKIDICIADTHIARPR